MKGTRRQLLYLLAYWLRHCGHLTRSHDTNRNLSVSTRNVAHVNAVSTIQTSDQHTIHVSINLYTYMHTTVTDTVSNMFVLLPPWRH